VRSSALVVSVLVLAIAAFAGGRALAGNRHPAQAFDPKAASYQPVAAGEGLSQAGFNGLEDGSSISGELLLSGKVVSLAVSTLTIAGPAGPTTLQVSGSRSLRRIAAATAADIAPGLSVIAILEPESDVAKSVLVIAPP
jgi:hypothetical protein